MMAYPPILFPDEENALVVFLTGKLGSATVHVKVPNPRPAKFVLVPRLGGTSRDVVVDTGNIGFECWATTDAEAKALAQLTRAHVNSLPGRIVAGVTFVKVEEFTGPQRLPDGVSNQSRYIFTSAVSFKGAAL